MPELEPCPFDNTVCMCQFCEEPCNNGLNCSNCRHSGRAEHSVYLCTGFTGSLEAYIKNWRRDKEEKP